MRWGRLSEVFAILAGATAPLRSRLREPLSTCAPIGDRRLHHQLFDSSPRPGGLTTRLQVNNLPHIINWRLLMVLLLAVPGFAESLFYSKHFPGSVPAYVSVDLNKDGSAVYKEAPDDDNPVEFKMASEETQQIFDLADKLDHFKRPLESGLKVARMGEKTFRFINGEEKHEVKFNFSLDENAKTLLDHFERITETQQLLFSLEKSVKFDKLGVNQALLQVESAWDRKRIVSADRFLPLLDRVAKNSSYLNMARERAGALAAAFRNPAPITPPEQK